MIKEFDPYTTVAYASGAAAKVMQRAGYSKAQFLRMMDAAWEIMQKDERKATTPPAPPPSQPQASA